MQLYKVFSYSRGVKGEGVLKGGRGGPMSRWGHVEGGDNGRAGVSYCSRGGWWAGPSPSGPLPDFAHCWLRQLEARSWVAFWQ